MTVSSVDLFHGVVVLSDGQRVDITKYLGPEEEAPPEGESIEVSGFDWVRSVVAGPDADGFWHTITISEDDLSAAKTEMENKNQEI